MKNCEQEECESKAVVLTATIQDIPMWLCGKCAITALRELSQKEEDNGKMRPMRASAT